MGGRRAKWSAEERKKAAEEGARGLGRREEMHGRGKESYAREQDLREPSEAELFYIMMVDMHRGN